MANIGQTLFRFAGALILAAGATAIDNPRVMADATLGRRAVAEAPVLIATVNIPEGAEIAPGAVAVVRWPAHVIPPGAYSSAESAVGRVAATAVFRGEPIMPGRLAQGREIRITPGKRAYSIRFNDVAGIAGMIFPNSRVDILVTIDAAVDGRMQRMVKIFMSNMRVLAIGAQVGREADGRPINLPVATLEFTPEEVERIAIAASQGTLSLALRGYGNSTPAATRGVTAVPAVEYFPNRAPRAPIVVARPPTPDTARVQIFRGAPRGR